MAFCDFVVKYDPEKDTTEELTKRIIYSVFVGRIKHKKPVVMGIFGDSGEGKSYAGLRFEELFLAVQGIDIMNCLQDINVYTPLEYPSKLQALLSEKRLKKVNILTMHEAREIIRAKDWQSFLTQSVADVNALSRAVKRLCIVIISQFIRDITSDMRYTVNFYCKVSRPKGKRARLYINVMWKDDRDIDKPKLRKRKLSGYLIGPNGVYRRYVPQYLELSPPRKEICEAFDKADTAAKATIIKHKLAKLMAEMKKDLEVNNKVDVMVQWYATNQEAITAIGKRVKGKMHVNGDFKAMHDLSPDEVKEFETKLNEALRKKGALGGEIDETIKIRSEQYNDVEDSTDRDANQ